MSRQVRAAILYARHEYAQRPPEVARRRGTLRWAVWGVALVFTPVLAMAAYQPAWLLAVNNLSDLTSVSTARTNLGLGTAAVQNVGAFAQIANNLSDVTAATARTNLAVPPSSRLINTTAPVTGGGDLTTDRTIAVSVATATASGLVPTPPNDATKVLLGTGVFGSVPAVAPVAPTIYTSTLPVTLANTDNLFEVIELATPASGVINLPTSPTAGMRICVKDGLKNFAANVATVKTTDSSTIDKVAGATGYAMNQNGQENCFTYASSGTNWYVR